MGITSLPLPTVRTGALASLAFALRAWHSITRREAIIALTVAVAAALISVPMALEVLAKPEKGVPALIHATAWTFVTCVLGLLTWVLADRASVTAADGEAARRRRMVAALLAGTLLSTIVLPLVLYQVIGVELPIVMLEEKPRPVPPLVIVLARGAVETLVFGGLAFGLIEARRRRRSVADALTSLQRRREELARRALEARLAVMQAQVEPHLLFDSLVHIDALYQRDTAQAAALLDRLIAYLRVALPQLRDSGSNAQGEADLVAAYLSVVAARHDGLPRMQMVVEPDAAAARFYPMLLLPLVQRAVRSADGDAGRLPAAIQLVMKRQGDTLVALLRIDASGQCNNDAELDRLRERLAALYGARATLACAESARGISEFSLRIPYEPAQPARPATESTDRPDGGGG